jgi:ABC-type multidrug transport system fused ATPase/permease subunit
MPDHVQFGRPCSLSLRVLHYTIIAIAHRLETILDFDRIVVLHKGELVECDSPSNLLARPSAFRELYEMYEMKKQENSSDVEA